LSGVHFFVLVFNSREKRQIAKDYSTRNTLFFVDRKSLFSAKWAVVDDWWKLIHQTFFSRNFLPVKYNSYVHQEFNFANLKKKDFRANFLPKDT